MSFEQEWHKDEFMISTKKDILQPAAINKALASDIMWWAKELPEDQLSLMLNNSICFGLYHNIASKEGKIGKSKTIGLGFHLTCTETVQIGLARLVTDFVTVAYLTDVYVLEEYQKLGLGSFIIRCMSEFLEEWPCLRALILVTSPKESPWYEKLLKADVLGSIHGHEVRVLVKNGKGR
jgi:hypothetical protein